VAEVTEVVRGDVMAKVKLRIAADSPLCSVLTTESVDDLGLAVGDRVKVVVKAIHVLLVKE
jgi:molybdopterin-binding protein